MSAHHNNFRRPAEWKAVPYRTGVVPQCKHECCLGRSVGKWHSDAPPLAQTNNRNSASSTSWAGPAGVTTVFFRVRQHHDDEVVAPAPTLAAAAATTTTPAAAAAPPVPRVQFLVGYDKNRAKYSVCSGTLSDSWGSDLGCGVLGAMREAAEEFKIVCKSPAEFMSNVAFWWWTGGTLLFAFDLDKFEQGDPRRELAYLKKSVAEALANHSLPPCEREITSLKIHGFDLTAKMSQIVSKRNEVTFSKFCLESMNSVLTALRKRFGYPNWREGGPRVAAVASVVSEGENDAAAAPAAAVNAATAASAAPSPAAVPPSPAVVAGTISKAAATNQQHQQQQQQLQHAQQQLSKGTTGEDIKK